MYTTKRDNQRLGMIKPKVNDISHDQATINLDPLPYNPDPSQPAQRHYSFDRSSYLFPKSLSSHRMNARAHNDSYDSPREERAPTRDEIVDAGTSRSDLPTCSSGKTSDPRSPPKKKSVGFLNDVTVHHLHSIPKSSDMSPKEKSEAWYGPNEYDQFKYQAAKQAGVKIVRYDSDQTGMGHHFVMCGDFDSRDGSDDNGKDASGSEVGCAGAGDKVHYNENEYNDRTHKNSSGKVVLNVCKRGLGYHFSRSRKKSRIVTRSAVVAWQKTLREQADESSKPVDDDAKQTSAGKTDGNTLGRREKSAMMLALVSTKCSRVAREEAGWRGDVDYRVAYPERHASKKAARAGNGSAVNNARKRSGRDRNSSSKNRPRPASGHCHRDGRSKRQRRNATVGQSCSDASNIADESGALSPTTIGYLSSVLHAEAV